MQQIISYIRVSTGKQSRSGLGIEAQRDAIARFAAAERREVVAEFVEVETGKGSDALDRRPKLAEAYLRNPFRAGLRDHPLSSAAKRWGGTIRRNTRVNGIGNELPAPFAALGTPSGEPNPIP